MKRFFTLMLAGLLLLGLGACGPTAPATLEEDEREMLRIMAGGKQFISELQNGKQPSNARFAEEDALAAFTRFFKIETLYVSGASTDPSMPDISACIISGYSEFNYGRSVEVLFTKGEPMEWSCPMAQAAANCDAVLDVYLGHLREKDAQGLASWLHDTPNAQELELAGNTIEYFNRWFDLSEVSVRESDLWGNDRFKFVIEDAKGITFEVELRYSDGSCFPVLLTENQR